MKTQRKTMKIIKERTCQTESGIFKHDEKHIRTEILGLTLRRKGHDWWSRNSRAEDVLNHLKYLLPSLFFFSYNAMSIRRLERDTSVDRLSTGSGASNMSTQSEWVDGQKVWSTFQFYLPFPLEFCP